VVLHGLMLVTGSRRLNCYAAAIDFILVALLVDKMRVE